MNVRLALMLCTAASAFAVVAGPDPTHTLPPPPDEPEAVTDSATCISCGGLLEDAELDQLQRDATHGDSQAAFRVAFHYASADNPAQHQVWMRRAAMLGHPIAQYNMWFALRDSDECSEQHEALAWLEQSGDQGVDGAKEQLQAFKQHVALCLAPPNNSFKTPPLRGAA